MWGHQHSYERLWPVFDHDVRNGTADADTPYTDPGAPVHVTTGSAGCKERHAAWRWPKPEFSAFR